MRKWQIFKGDKIIWIIVILLSMFSVVAVFSSSTVLANYKGADYSKINFLLIQLRNVGLGFFVLYLCYLIPLVVYRNAAFIAFGITTLMLLMVFVISIAGAEGVNGANRSLLGIQVFEFAKVGLILYLARALELWEGKINTFKDFFIKLLLPVGVTCIMIVPNSFSSAVLFGFISILVMFFMKVKIRFLLLTAVIALGFAGILFGIYMINPNSDNAMLNRIGTVVNRVERWSSSDQNEDGTEKILTTKELNELRQSANAEIAISEGGIIGKGPGKSTQRYSLSLAFSDFIFAFIVEEYGLIGGFVLIMLYLVLLFRCILIAVRCNTPFSSTMVLGLSFLIGAQAFLHIFVNTGIFPVTGHTLPLVSHGGTSFVVLSAAFGIIISISKQLDKQDERLKAERESMNDQTNEFENE